MIIPILYALAASAIAIALLKLGAMSVWLTLLTLVLKSVLAIAALGAVVILGHLAWRRWR